MTNQDFIAQAASLLARCSDEQRTQLATMAQNFGKPDAPVPAMDGASKRHPSFDEMLRSDPDYGKSLEERFPDMNRLRG